MPVQIIVQREHPPTGFDPADLTVEAGDAVFWFNADHKTEHQIYPEGGKPGDWGDPVPPQNSSDQINMTPAGNYPYRCALHVGETGIIHAT